MSKPLITMSPISAVAHTAANVSIVTGLLFTIFLGSLHILEPEYDPTWRFISEYALGNVGWLMNLAFFALALSLLSAGIALRSQVRTISGYIGLGILGIASVGITLAGIFNTDPTSLSPEQASFSGTMHVLGASLDFTPVAALLLCFSLSRNQAWRAIRARLFITAGITILMTVAFFISMPADYQFGPGVYTGLVGRLLLVSYLGWLLTVGGHVRKLYNPEVSLDGASTLTAQ